MVNKNYIRGRTIEYKCIKELGNQGFVCIRTAGSHSPVDVIAIRYDRILLIQCKRQKKDIDINYGYEVQELVDIQIDNPFVEKWLWVWIDRKGWKKSVL